MVRLKAISLWEPWASLMATGAKKIETRSWSTTYRGPLLICASKRCVRWEIEDDLEDPDFQQGLAPLLNGQARRVGIGDLLFGNAVALVDLVDCKRTENLDPGYPEAFFGNYEAGRFGWITTNLRRLRPFPVTGKQGLFDVEAAPELLVPLSREQENNKP